MLAIIDINAIMEKKPFSIRNIDWNCCGNPEYKTTKTIKAALSKAALSENPVNLLNF